jgi:hypothetical protein
MGNEKRGVFVTQKCKISVKFSGRLPVYSITDAVSHCLVDISFKSGFTEHAFV